MSKKKKNEETIFKYVGLHKWRFILSSILAFIGSAAGITAYVVISRMAIRLFLGQAEQSQCIAMAIAVLC